MFQKLAALAVFAALALPAQAQAHSLWVNMSHWTPSVQSEKASTRMYVGWGHAYPVDGLTDSKQFASCELIDPRGKRTPLQLDREGISTAPVQTPMDGEYIVSLLRRPSIYTMYLENGVEKKTYEPRQSVKNRIKTIRSQQSATAHFFAGNRTAKQPMSAGNTLELVPLENPYAPGKNYVGTTLPVQLLLDKTPVPYVEVTATYAGFSSGDAMAQRLLTDKNGIAHLRITHWGPWLLKAKAERPATKKFANIADVEVYYTTLTFEI